MELIKIVMVKMKSSLAWMEMEMAFHKKSIVMIQNQIYTLGLRRYWEMALIKTVMVSMEWQESVLPLKR